MKRRYCFLSLLSLLLLSCDGDLDSPSSVVSASHPIIHGHAATNEPATVALMYLDDYGKSMDPDSPSAEDAQETSPDASPKATVSGDSFCSGTLIHPQWVLTAAHCILEGDSHTEFSKRLSDIRIGIGQNTSAVLSYNPEMFYYNTKYQTNAHAGDIALIQLRDPVPSNVATPVLPLPPWLAFRSSDLPIDMRTSGFGYDENGMSDRRLTVDLATTGYCGKYNPDDDSTCTMEPISYSGCHPKPSLCEKHGYASVTNEYVSIPYGSIFAPIPDKGQCHGDSGGPTYYKVGGIEYVAGVTSYGDVYCRGYNVAVAVADYYDWIESVAPDVTSQYYEICGNGIDDDGDDLIDDDDPACAQPQSECGNGWLDDGEVCDGTNFASGDSSCRSWSSQFTSGELQCAGCKLDFSNCKTELSDNTCGNGVLDYDEYCDGNLFYGGRTACSAWDDSYSSGTVSCYHCTLNYDRCVTKPSCGNGILEYGEPCDGYLFLGGWTTCSAWDDKYSSGSVSCNHCALDYSQCTAKPTCGNGVLDNGEACDGNLFYGGKTACSTWSANFISGNVSCNQCALDYSSCVEKDVCGNGILDNSEPCDGNMFAGGKTACSAWNAKYISGNVSCNKCAVDYSQCVIKPVCGNGVLNDGEPCDGKLFAGGKTACSAWDEKYASGNVLCNDCTLDYSKCSSRPTCGNGILDAGESCDGVLYAGGNTACSAWNEKYIDGDVSCKDCAVDYRKCVAKSICGNKHIDDGEPCDGELFASGKAMCNQWDSKYRSGKVSCNNCALDFSACELAHCGNGVLDEGEQCEGTLFAKDSLLCSDWDPKYVDGHVSCSYCNINYGRCVAKPSCGNGILDNGEPCEGNLFAEGKTLCSAWNDIYNEGDVSCKDDCSIDYSQCIEKPGCGNGILDEGELCDGNLFARGTTLCSDWDPKYVDGDVSCKNCTVNYRQCITKALCGNDILDTGEPCDEKLFANGKTLCSAWNDRFISGEVSCNDCAVDYSQCVENPCGNGVLDEGEMCDGNLFAEDKVSCHDWNAKYVSGDVSCNACVLDFGNCFAEPTCGNGAIENGEPCDGTLFAGGKTACSAWDAKYASGKVSCHDCALDYSQCVEKPDCGNGILDSGEACDGNLFAGGNTSCDAWDASYIGGTVRCKSNCTIDVSQCKKTTAPVCGNGMLESGEPCDGNLFIQSDRACSAWSSQFVSGRVQCKGCKLDLSDCREAPPEPVCGNGVLDEGEACDGTLFRNNYYSCHNWNTRYTEGFVSCSSACTIDLSSCPDASKNKDADDSGCSAHPMRGTHNAAWLLGLLGLGMVLLRRSRKEGE